MDSGGGRIYSMYETLCTVADMGGHRGAGRCMYMHGNENLSMLYSKGDTDEDRMIQGRSC